MEAFGENLNTRMDTIEPLEEFPYTDGMWAPMWSNQHAAIVGVGVYVMDDNGAYTMAGPETSGYSSSNLPAVMSIRYLTGADANTAAADMEDADQLSDIVDVDQHDLSQITQDLQDAGIDTSGLDLETPVATTETQNKKVKPKRNPTLTDYYHSSRRLLCWESSLLLVSHLATGRMNRTAVWQYYNGT